MLASWAQQTIGDQHERPIAQPRRVPALAPGVFVEHRIEAERAPRRVRDQHRAPVPGCDRSHVLAFDAISLLLAMQQTPQLRQIEMRREQILAAKIENGAVLGFAGLIAIASTRRTYSRLTPLLTVALTTRRNIDPAPPIPAKHVPATSMKFCRFAIVNNGTIVLYLSLQNQQNHAPTKTNSIS